MTDAKVYDMMLNDDEYAVARAAIEQFRAMKDSGFIADCQRFTVWDAGRIIEQCIREGRHIIEGEIEMDRVLQAHKDELDNTYGERYDQDDLHESRLCDSDGCP